MGLSTTFVNSGGGPEPVPSPIILTGSSITLSGGAGVFGDLASLELPLPDC